MYSVPIGSLWTKYIPIESPLNDPWFLHGLWISILIQHTLFHALSNTTLSGSDPKQQKKRAWILTTFNGFVTTLLSLPYLWDLVTSNFDLHQVRTRLNLTHLGCAFFVVYLLSDLTLGSIYYRKLINLSSGWIHHTVYIFLFNFWVHKGWAHIAMMASIFELPTFIMGIASIHPPLRSNNAFTSTFLTTRIGLHSALLFASSTKHGRSAPGVDGSWGPCICLAATLPMHLWWGYKCILSVRRRMHKRKLAARAEREKEANSALNIAAQAFNGFKSPDASSAVNTPLPTPSPSPILGPVNYSASSAAAIQNAFAKAASASRRPVDLVLRKRPKSTSSDRGTETPTNGSSIIPDIQLPSAVTGSIDDDGTVSSVFLSRNGSSEGGLSTTDNLLQVPSRTSTAAASSSASPSQLAARDPRHSPSIRPFTAPVRPLGASTNSHEPFLAIRSPAEGTDRARRLVADIVRKMWFGAPENWRKEFEKEAKLMQLHGPQNQSLQLDQDDDDEELIREIEKDDNQTDSKGDRARALLRRGVLRAVTRAINGSDTSLVNESAENDGEELILVRPEEEPTELSLDNDQEIAATQKLATSLMALSRRTLLVHLPPDLIGRQEEYSVRPLEVEKVQGNGTKRFIAKLRRKMQVRNRDVVVWD
ncbi:unnamed protein product [Sympodiomycopsis kandeliae]